MQGVGEESGKKKKKHGMKRKADFDDNGDARGIDDSLSVKMNKKKKKKKKKKKVEHSREVSGLEEASVTCDKSSVEESEMSECRTKLKRCEEGKKGEQTVRDKSILGDSLENSSKKKEKSWKKKHTLIGKDGETIECEREKLDRNTKVMEKEIKKKKKKNKELLIDSDAEDSTPNKLCGKEALDETEQPDGKASERDENSREGSGKKKKKKDKKKVGDLEAENWEASESSKTDRASEGDQRDEMPRENIDDSSDDTNRKTRKKKLRADKSTDNSNEEVKKKHKKKQNEGCGAKENMVKSERDTKKKRKEKQEQIKNAEETPSSSKSAKKVKFSDQVDVFPLSDGGVSADECEEDEEENVELVRGKRFSKEEDALVKAAVLEYIDTHGLGDEGLDMVMKCKSHPQVKNCWKEIGAALPWRTRDSVYYRAHILFEGGSDRSWTPEQLELVKSFAEKHGPDWKTLAEAMGKHRWHVKDTWRRIRLPNMNKAKWSCEEYQALFDLVNIDLRTKALQEKKSKHGMLRDNIPWTAISDQLGTRNHAICCTKWYNQLTSPMVAEGIWDNADDYYLLNELLILDAACIEDVEWDSLLENRSGELCRKRWNQMVLHIGVPGTKSFSDQVEILANRYCPDLAEEREEFDNRPYDDDVA